MKIERLDHLVLTVRDVSETCTFYERVLGMEVTIFGDGREALVFGEQKINLHQQGREYEPKAANPIPGSADLCFIAGEDPPTIVEHLRACEVEIVEGPVERAGALGPMISVYFRDPDRNLIELSNYGGALYQS
jgi:catechol 2,3-dioxygenase-like lactoylglutathione lyase family enzyme